MTLHNLNRKIINLGETLRSRYLYQMQENKDLVSYIVAKHCKNQIIKNKIINLVQCH